LAVDVELIERAGVSLPVGQWIIESEGEKRFVPRKSFLQFPEQMPIGFLDRIVGDLGGLFVGKNDVLATVLFLARAHVCPASLDYELAEKLVVKEDLVNLHLILIE